MSTEFKVTGKITKINEVKTGETKKGDPYKAVDFLLETSDEYNNLYKFDLFQMGDKDAVDKFIQFNKVGQDVDVKFNVRTQEYEGKHYVSLSAWSVFTLDEAKAPVEAVVTESDDLPF